MVATVMYHIQRKERNEDHVVVGERDRLDYGSEHAIYPTVLLEGGHPCLSSLQYAVVRSGTRERGLFGERIARETSSEVTQGATGGESRRRATRKSPRSVKRGAQFPWGQSAIAETTGRMLRVVPFFCCLLPIRSHRQAAPDTYK